MKKIQINFLPYNINRFKYSVWCLNELTKIKDSNKEKILLKIYTSYYHEDYNNVIEFLRKNNIDCELINMHGYMPKIYKAINTNEFYSCKWDEDIFLNYESWNYILENLDYLDENEDIIFFSPILTNGIPSVDLFVHESFSSDYKNQYINLIKNTNMIGNELANSWGVNYSGLNSETINSDRFDSEKYYKQVSKINHYYKGIHPVRISIDLHNLIFDFIQNNKDFFYTLCYKSKKWVKWVNSNFNPEENKLDLILISGHYVFSNIDFQNKINNFNGIDSFIKERIRARLIELLSI